VLDVETLAGLLNAMCLILGLFGSELVVGSPLERWPLEL